MLEILAKRFTAEASGCKTSMTGHLWVVTLVKRFSEMGKISSIRLFSRNAQSHGNLPGV
jgi:hypothetical protein